MAKNMGTIDKIIRVLAAVVVAILYFTNQITGTAAVILGVIAVIFIATSLMGYCPLYSIFKINTGKK